MRQEKFTNEKFLFQNSQILIVNFFLYCEKIKENLIKGNIFCFSVGSGVICIDFFPADMR